MKRNGDNQYGYSTWSMEEVMRFVRFFLLPLLVVVLIVVILAMDKKKNPAPEASAIEENADLELAESVPEEEPESLPVQTEPIFTANSVPAVTDLLNRYFSAKEKADARTIYQLFGWTGELGLEEVQRQLQYDARYTEGYRNIVCYTVPGEIEGTYLVCVSYDLKFKNSLTLAPGFQWSYVRTGMDGNLYLTVEDELSEPEKAFIQEALKADEIVLLRVEIYAKLRAALESDSALAESYGILEKKGGSAGANQAAEQHEANVQIDGLPAAENGGEAGEGNEEGLEGSQGAEDSGDGTVGDGMIHIEGSSPEGGESGQGEAAQGQVGGSSVSLQGNTEETAAGAPAAEGVAGEDGSVQIGAEAQAGIGAAGAGAANNGAEPAGNGAQADNHGAQAGNEAAGAGNGAAGE